MRTNRLAIGAFASLLVLFACRLSPAVVIYDNSTNFLWFTGSIVGRTPPGSPQRLAMPFTPQGSDFQLDSGSIALRMVQSQQPTEAVVSLIADNQGLPGATIESWNVNALGVSPQ